MTIASPQGPIKMDQIENTTSWDEKPEQTEHLPSEQPNVTLKTWLAVCVSILSPRSHLRFVFFHRRILLSILRENLFSRLSEKE